MLRSKSFSRIFLVLAFSLATSSAATAQRAFNASANSNSEFGPVMQAYLGYLRNEQEVVDDRNSRREITADYYRRNSNRIRALRQMAIRLVTKSGNDYVPELEAVTTDEFGTLFENPPNPRSFRMNQVIMNTFRYLGSVNSGELFYVFARLDPYEQAALIESRGSSGSSETPDEIGSASSAKGQPVGQPATRPRRTTPR
jgi:hypothetical protein